MMNVLSLFDGMSCGRIALEVMELCMTARPDWLSAGKLPLKCSRDAALRYGDAK